MRKIKPGTDILEYSYSRSMFRKRMLTYFIIWLVVRTIRIIAYVYTDSVYEPALLIYMLTFVTGILFGLAGHAILVYQNSMVAYKDVDKRE